MIYAVLVVDHRGRSDYARNVPSGQVALYASRKRADAAAQFWRDGIGDEVQSVSVVRYRQVAYKPSTLPDVSTRKFSRNHP